MKHNKGYKVSYNLLNKKITHPQIDLTCNIAKRKVKKLIKDYKLPSNHEIKTKQYIFGGEKVIQVYIECPSK